MKADHPKMEPESHHEAQNDQVTGKLYDLLTGDSDFQAGAAAALRYLLASLGGQAAALFLPRGAERVSQKWVFVDLPGALQEPLQKKQSAFSGYIEQALASGEVFPGNTDQNLAGIFPLVSGGSVTGALLLLGPEIPPAAYPMWRQGLQPFIRILALVQQHERPPSQAELINSRNTLRALFDSLPISIYIIDRSYRLVAVNNSRADRTGESPKELVSGYCYEKLFRRDEPCEGCLAMATFATGKNTARLHRAWLEHDAFVEWEINTFPVQAETEAPAQIIVVEADVTEKRNLEANLIQSEKLAAVGQLAAGVAHEINNPLTAIIANIQLLRREIDPQEVDLLDSVNLIETASTRAQQVVRNLLGIARKEKYQFEFLDLNETLQNALTLVQHELVGRPIQVQLSLAEDMPLLLGSQDHLQGVWINLLINAIDAIDKNNGLIGISSRYNGTGFEIIVQDNGVGITPEYLGRIFEPFFTTKASGRGTGLGLSLCLRVVRQHGGDMLVESEAGRWTRFTITFPNSAAKH